MIFILLLVLVIVTGCGLTFLARRTGDWNLLAPYWIVVILGSILVLGIAVS